MKPGALPSMKSAKNLTVFVLLAAALGVPSGVAAGGEPATIPSTDHEITVDARLDEPAWEEALALPLEWEWFPSDNDPAPVETTAFVTFDAENLYVAFRARDPEPAAIRAHYGDRDTVASDDTVGFMIDPFSDQRRAYQFRINPLGVQMDALNSDVEQTEDFSWDAIWESAGRITEGGYVVEAAVPFRQLRFPRTENPQAWGVLAMRDYPRSVRHRLRSIVTDKDRDCLVCQLQPIRGFSGMTTGSDLEVVPTLTGRWTEERADGLTGELETSEEELDPIIEKFTALKPQFLEVIDQSLQMEMPSNDRFYFLVYQEVGL